MASIDLFSEFRISLTSYFMSKGIEINPKSFRLTQNHIPGDIIICSRYFESTIDEDTMLELKSHAWPLPILDVRWQKYRLSLSLNRTNVLELGFKSLGSLKSIDRSNSRQIQVFISQFKSSHRRFTHDLKFSV